ncbi:hypothetical protein RSal33209_0077 [Renibacterium salmoninarum ATCC 33209]|uniref:Uncharacterized protein n=1 Tax=Renibacterium salmoninarum (strain ATCC 33209 / DSM 20767 / JCM 11484 / NBRC 15589 / NCIMB 2235) TaxID=288705 RepID=A9WLQ3_RENSM|nr:hypothetical protein RSal33209_0077 [Renibacterium salmoninarum ATCC 33209]
MDQRSVFSRGVALNEQMSAAGFDVFYSVSG